MNRAAVLALLRRPRLWPAARALIPPRWWKRWPPTPWPPEEYVRFRLQTMYGDAGQPFPPEDLIAYLEWCRRMRRPAR